MAHESFSEFFRIVLKMLAKEHPQKLFSEDPQKLHRAFYQIAQQYGDRFPALGELHFITAGAHPYSAELTEALDLLQMSGAIARQNPSYEFFSVREYKDTADVNVRDRALLIGNDDLRADAFEQIVNSLNDALVVES